MNGNDENLAKERFLAQVVLWADGKLAAEEIAALEEQMQQSAECRQWYIHAQVQMYCLATHFQERDGASPPISAKPARQMARLAWLAAAAAVVGLACSLLIWSWQSSDTGLSIASADGPVRVVRHQRFFKLEVGKSLRVGDVVSSETGNVVVSYLQEGTRIVLAPESRLEVLRQVQGKQLRLLDGSLSAEVAPQPADKPMRLLGPNAEAVVLGTRFTFSVGEKREELAVQEGAVRVNRADASDSVVVNSREQVNVSEPQLSVSPLVQQEGSAWNGAAELRFDFETQDTAYLWRNGRIADVPEQEKTGYCLATEIFQNGSDPLLRCGVTLRERFVVSEGAVFKARCLATPGVGEIRLILVRRDKAEVQSYGYRFLPPEHDQWFTLTLPLTQLQFEHVQDSGRQVPLPIGCEIHALAFVLPRGNAAPPTVYFDDVIIENIGRP